MAEVAVGLRGAVRRLLKGTMPRHTLAKFAMRFRANVIPWEFVDLIEVDPARRVKLKIEHARLSHMHPSDLADILEDLPPPEREAIFVSLDEEVAAEALEEVDPRLQKSLARVARLRPRSRHRRRDGSGGRRRSAGRALRRAFRGHPRRNGAGRAARSGGTARIPGELRRRQNDHQLCAGRLTGATVGERQSARCASSMETRRA